MHAERLKSIIPAERCSEILLPYAGHAVVFYLLEVGLLKQVSLNVLTGKPVEVSELEIRRLSKRRFDEQFYTHLYWDVSPTGLSPILHYIRYRRAERRIIRFKQQARGGSGIPQLLRARPVAPNVRP